MPETGPAADSSSRVTAMFDRIAPAYDRLNRLLSLRRDVAWRRALAASVPGGATRVLDLCTGTGDVLLALRGTLPAGARLTGLDASDEMLRVGRGKLDGAMGESRYALVHGLAESLPFEDSRFDAVTAAFGVRNLAHCLDETFAEALRVLRPGGAFCMLELCLPRSAPGRRLYLAYFRHMLPRIGGLFSGDAAAYRYLNRSVERFDAEVRLPERLARAGFANVRTSPMTFGIAAVTVACKPGAPPPNPRG